MVVSPHYASPIARERLFEFARKTDDRRFEVFVMFIAAIHCLS